MILKICPVNPNHLVEERESGFSQLSKYQQCLICKEDVAYLAKTHPVTNHNSLGPSVALKYGSVNSNTIQKCLVLVNQRHNKNIDLLSIPNQDPIVFQEFLKGNIDLTLFADPVPRIFLKVITDLNKLDSVEELAHAHTVASSGFVRLGYDKRYTQFVNSGLTTNWMNYPNLKFILENTKGFILYTQQISAILLQLGGFSFHEVATVLKVLTKTKHTDPAYRIKFIQSAQSSTISATVADYIWSDICRDVKITTDYAHAMAWAYTVYYSMWLKYYYPKEWTESQS